MYNLQDIYTSTDIAIANTKYTVHVQEKKVNKTWSLVSNSSLSKTFALCQFRKLKVQKLCFLRPNIVFIEIHFESEQILGMKKKLVQK